MVVILMVMVVMMMIVAVSPSQNGIYKMQKG